MSSATHYKMTILSRNFDKEYVFYKLFRDTEAKDYINEDGTATGNGYDWRSMNAEMRDFSETMPEITFEIVEYGTYDNESFEYRHYFKDGLSTTLTPTVVTTWPFYTEALLT